ncbi:MAG: P-loop NTPase [Myxococcota bacterium]
MPTIVTFASGKGGVGKSVTVSNLGLALAAAGHDVVIADCDLGGGNLETLFGAFETGPSLDDFLNRKIRSLGEATRRVRPNLSLISGAGESLATANPNWAMKQRLLRQLRDLDAEIVLVDVGAGTGNDALDFFCAGDIRVLVTLPEPTASVDAYRFLKLAHVRESATQISARNPERRQLERSDPQRAQDVWKTVPLEADKRPSQAPPCVILNQAGDARQSFHRLRLVSRRFLECDLELLGQIPSDDAVRASVSRFLPILEGDPASPASRAFSAAADALSSKIQALTPANEGPALPDLNALTSDLAVDRNRDQRKTRQAPSQSA